MNCHRSSSLLLTMLVLIVLLVSEPPLISSSSSDNEDEDDSAKNHVVSDFPSDDDNDDHPSIHLQPQTENIIEMDTDTSEVSENNAILQVNPAYTGPLHSEHHNVDHEEYEDNMNDASKSKLAISNALLSSSSANTTAYNLALTTRRHSIAFFRKHGFKTVLLLTLYAFRKEIRLLIYNLCTKPVQDPQTGEWVRRPVPISATAILKIFLFIDLMRRIQQSSTSSSSSSSSNSNNGDSMNNPPLHPSSLIAFLLAAGGCTNPFLTMFLSRLFEPANSAYVPPIEQHYTFERLNQRYNRDAEALRKVLSMTRGNRKPDASKSLSSSRGNSSGSSSNRRTPFPLAGIMLGNYMRGSNRIAATDPTSLLSNSLPVNSDLSNSTLIVMDWTNLDTGVSQLKTLRDQVSFLLSQIRCHRSPSDQYETAIHLSTTNATAENATTKALISSEPPPAIASLSDNENDIMDVEIVVLLESPGGSAGDYALAAQQILRLRNSGFQVTICVDKVAASGGYMIASCASPGRLFAAPLAIVGSIGVIGQSINVHKILKGWGVEPLVFRGGRDKAPVGLIGDVTREGLEKVQSIVDNTHRAFKRHVSETRPILSDRIEELATGDIWLGYDALDVGLVDRIVTSDEYVQEQQERGAFVLKLVKLIKPRYPFSRPTTLNQEMSANQLPLSNILAQSASSLVRGLANEFQQLAQQISRMFLDISTASDDPASAMWTVKASASAAAAIGRRESYYLM